MINWHHSVDAIWQMTPRQIFAWVTLGLDREKMERATRLVDATSAARGEGGEIQRTIRELTGG